MTDITQYIIIPLMFLPAIIAGFAAAIAWKYCNFIEDPSKERIDFIKRIFKTGNDYVD